MARASAAEPCAVSGCRDQARTPCARCSRKVCARHGGAAPARRSAKRAGAAATKANVQRCALCRLDERRRAGDFKRRVWIGVSIAGFVLLEGVVFHSNPRQGVALLLVALLVAVLAVVYDRAMRRGGFALPSLHRRGARGTEPLRDQDRP